jgi:N-acetylmuramoyl-L-alanine amidase
MGESVTHEGSVYPAEIWLDRQYELLGSVDPNTKASAHVLVQPDGTLVHCLDHQTKAWHAGESVWMGYESLNHHFLGIEVLVAGIHTWRSYLLAIGRDPSNPTAVTPPHERPVSPYRQKQYESTAWCIRQWMKECPEIDRQMIVGHEQVAPDRKPDPGPLFDWDQLWGELSKLEIMEGYDADQEVT